MINGVNTVDFKFATAESKNASISTELPKGRSDLISVFQYAYSKPEASISSNSLSNTKEFALIQSEPIGGLERVHVQRLQTHAQLRNNRWKNYQTFYSLNAGNELVMDSTKKTPNNNNINSSKSSSNNNINNSNNNNNIIIGVGVNNNNNNKNIENKSAFSKCNNNNNNNKEEEQDKHNSNGEGKYLENLRNTQLELKMDDPSMMMRHNSKMMRYSSDSGSRMPNIFNNMGDKLKSDTLTGICKDDTQIQMQERNSIIVPNYYRTEDQENAFRRIEDVHNYAKLNRYGNSNDSSDGSMREYDDDDDDDEEDDDDDADDGEDADDGDDYEDAEDVYRNVKNKMKKGVMATHSAAHFDNKAQIISKTSEDTDAIVDIETVAGENEQQIMQSPPAHHARRPMNAFLIFCKRHRAIVKDRYKSLENRAITKILGDWWASLDGDEKDCFTKLAQQNKDAFFSAHPNFKWYKLPAPPLRTLSTRPTNAERTSEEMEYETDETMKMPNKTSSSSSYFKLADEAQMGELNSLINVKNKKENSIQCPLQKALGETTHFLSAHMPTIGKAEFNDSLNETKCSVKRRAVTENSSFSSNSSEDDVLPKKTSRSCKGKIYQELVSSGQIAPVTKKARTAKTPGNSQFSLSNESLLTAVDASDINNTISEANDTINAASYSRVMDGRGNTTKRTVSSSSETNVAHNHHRQHQHLHHQFGDQFGQFDLEEKIKKLPALSLDAYLQRKRNTKKKKKFTGKKRSSNSVSLPITETRPIVSNLTPPKEEMRNKCSAAVGSQKRKARKESITRRDISAIESEVASIIPLTSNFNANNGCYYFNEMSTVTSQSQLQHPSTPTATATSTTPNSSSKCTEIASVPYSTQITSANDSSRAYNNYVDSITTTSDLFILAEVAAKRTELTN